MKTRTSSEEGTADAAFDREWRIIQLAKQEHHLEGECEIDDMAQVSEGAGNGAYVQAWVWVDFSDTDLDKEASEETPQPAR